MKNTILALSLLTAFSCASTPKAPMGMAMLMPSGGQSARGMIHLGDAGERGVEVQVDLVGVPEGTHGFHVHEVGDCGNNGQASGGHFNPTGVIHGAPDAVSHHAGDFGNVTADASGAIKTTFTTHSISLKEGTSNYVVGRAIVLHANADDLTSQPAGNAGARIACGVVTVMAGDMQHH